MHSSFVDIVSIALLTTSLQYALSDALHQAEFNRRVSDLRSFFTVCNQEVVGPPQHHFHARAALPQYDDPP